MQLANCSTGRVEKACASFDDPFIYPCHFGFGVSGVLGVTDDHFLVGFYLAAILCGIGRWVGGIYE